MKKGMVCRAGIQYHKDSMLSAQEIFELSTPKNKELNKELT
jgi:hypothetical protein